MLNPLIVQEFMTSQRSASQQGPFRSIVVLTGAGISAESGIQTFRAADGLWENHRVEEVASPEGYARNPALVRWGLIP